MGSGFWREAGVRTYVENTVARDYVLVGGGIIGIYSVAGGRKTIKPLKGGDRMVEMPPFTTQYFDIETGECK